MRISDWSSDVCSSDLLGPDNGERFRAAMAAAKAALEKKLQAEHDPSVRQDLQIMIKAADEGLQGSALRERLQIGRAACRESVSVGVDLGGDLIIKNNNTEPACSDAYVRIIRTT